jgi:hypothetical protein
MNIAKLPELVGRKRPEMKNALAMVPSISAYTICVTAVATYELFPFAIYCEIETRHPTFVFGRVGAPGLPSA